MTTPAISVLLPYRDVTGTIEEAIETTLDQAGVSVEIIAVDDGSRDDGPARVARLAVRHRAIIRLRTEGIGLAGALNLAAREARAPLLARMDGDDVSLPGRFARQLDALAAVPDLAVIGARVEAFPDEAVGEGLSRYVAWQNAILGPEAHARALLIESPLCHPSTVMRREPLFAVGLYRDFDGPEDWDLWLRLDEAGYRMAKVPEVLLRWRQRPGRHTFTSPRCAPDCLAALRLLHLARRLRARALPAWIWGAGPTGRRLARALESHGLRAARFIDVDPAKIGRTARGAPVVGLDAVAPGPFVVVVAVGARGARDQIRAFLDERGFREGADYWCAA